MFRLTPVVRISPETSLCLVVISTYVIFLTSTFDELLKNRKIILSVIPADPGSSPGGILSFQTVTEVLDSGFHRSDDFLRNRQL